MTVSTDTLSTDTLVQVSNLRKSYGSIQALAGISFSIQRNEVVALLGENGAGKSTCLNTLLGRTRPDAGELRVFGCIPGHLSAKQRIGVMLQSAALPDNLTVFEQLRLFASYYPQSRSLKEVASTAMLDGLLDRKIQGLSGGQKQRLLFAMAIVGDPELVVLDEPTMGLDVGARRQFWTCIRALAEQGVSVLLTTHYLDEADVLADRIMVLSGGHLAAQGSVQQIKSALGGKRVSFACLSTLDTLQATCPNTKFARNGQMFSTTTSTPETLLAALFAAGVEVCDLCVTAVSLEDAFLHLTQVPQPVPETKKEQTA